jgi:hypothetical protein
VSYASKKMLTRDVTSGSVGVVQVGIVLVVAALALLLSAVIAVAWLVILGVRMVRRRSAARRLTTAAARPDGAPEPSADAGVTRPRVPLPADAEDAPPVEPRHEQAAPVALGRIEVFLRPDGQWARKKQGAKRTGSVHSTQQEAADAALRQAQRELLDVLVFDASGVLAETHCLSAEGGPSRDWPDPTRA